MTPEERKHFQDYLDRASEIVKSWPAWKRGILEHSSKPTNSVPRKPVVNNTVPPRPNPAGLSDAERRMFDALGFATLSEVWEAPITLYDHAAKQCFMHPRKEEDHPGAAKALRRGLIAIQRGFPYRCTPEFDILVDF